MFEGIMAYKQQKNVSKIGYFSYDSFFLPMIFIPVTQ